MPGGVHTPFRNSPGLAGGDALNAFAALAARRPRTALIDWRIDRPELHDPNQFRDPGHYRQPLARLVEADIEAALATMR
ncbi:hypothetical protein IP69_06205 [Bosea sp. AAP35]|uniref:hypothetical protein n=1 Tax=Bosea sp. AAP35 TaxID=1523417 RepID=UPI0006B9D14E|nr:hypothetical protein [Bosea sp. AAP35]KPF71560.1 hypothetical protein IP69_06205 [Bosea sp. AAP35]